MSSAATFAGWPEGATPSEMIWRRRSLRLRRYRAARGLPGARIIPLLIVPSLINRHTVMDLLPGRSLVEYLLGQGFAVYLVDWGHASAEDRHLDLDYCLEDLLGAAVERTCRDSGVNRVNLLGYCMGATMSVIYTALHPQWVNALVSLAGPIDFDHAGVLGRWTDPRWFKPHLIVDALGNLPGSMMRSAFSSLVPTAQLAKVAGLLERAGDPDFVRTFVATERWVNDSTPFPGAAYVGYIRDLYQRNLLFRGELRVRGRLVDLGCIRCPVRVIVASRDHIVPPAAATALIERCNSSDTSLTEVPGGHVGAVIGGGARKRLWPALDEWLAPRSIRGEGAESPPCYASRS